MELDTVVSKNYVLEALKEAMQTRLSPSIDLTSLRIGCLWLVTGFNFRQEGWGRSDDCWINGRGPKTVVVLWYFCECVCESMHPRKLVEIWSCKVTIIIIKIIVVCLCMHVYVCACVRPLGRSAETSVYLAIEQQKLELGNLCDRQPWHWLQAWTL